MPIPPTCTANRNNSSLSFESQTGRARALADLLAANVACPAFGAVCIPYSVLVGARRVPDPRHLDGHALSVTGWMISRHRVFSRCRLGFSAIRVNTGAPGVCGTAIRLKGPDFGAGRCEKAATGALTLMREMRKSPGFTPAGTRRNGSANAPVFSRYPDSAKTPILVSTRQNTHGLHAAFFSRRLLFCGCILTLFAPTDAGRDCAWQRLCARFARV